MTAKDLRWLRRLGRLFGVQPGYRDVRHRVRAAGPEEFVEVLRLLGAELEGPRDFARAWRTARLEQWRRVLEPVSVIWEGEPARWRVRLPASWGTRRMKCRLKLESGEVCQWSVRPAELKCVGGETLEGRRYEERELGFPGDMKKVSGKRGGTGDRGATGLPLGYHTLFLESPSGEWEGLVMAAPRKSFTPENRRRQWGVFLPLYALHGRESWGAGSLGDLEGLCRWVGSEGGSVVGTLPLLPAFLNEPFEPSPYSPVSRLFWNEFYVEVRSLPEWGMSGAARRLASGGAFRSRLGKLRGLEEVDYREQMALKRRVLELLAREFFERGTPARRAAFRGYLRARPEAEDYAAFRATQEGRGSRWREWPARMRDGRLRPGDYRAALARYHLYAQWVAEEQMASVCQRAGADGVRLYLDLPLGTHSEGYDAWRERSWFAEGASGGSPPDPVFVNGQDWGFAPMHPHRMREGRYGYVLRMLRHHMRHAGWLRLDHVMGLHRLYWVPTGFPASRGVYVRYPAEELYALLNLESHRHGCVIVGENLGTVPPEVNRAMQRHDIREMYVVEYEAQPKGRTVPRAAPRRSAASLNTHDMPTFAAFVEGLDIEDRQRLGLLSRREVRLEKKGRRRLNQRLVEWMRRRGLWKGGNPGAAGLLRGCLEYLGAGSAELVLVNLEDLWLEKRPQNVPGTGTERPNWRRKTRWGWEEISCRAEVRDLLARLDRLRSGRAARAAESAARPCRRNHSMDGRK